MSELKQVKALLDSEGRQMANVQARYEQVITQMNLNLACGLGNPLKDHSLL